MGAGRGGYKRIRELDLRICVKAEICEGGVNVSIPSLGGIETRLYCRGLEVTYLSTWPNAKRIGTGTGDEVG